MNNTVLKLTAGTLYAAVLSAGLTSCQPETSLPCDEEGIPTTLTISIGQDDGMSKAVQTAENNHDNRINTLDVFIFNYQDRGSARYGKLDTYKRFEGGNTSNLQISATTGTKMICVVANSNIPSYNGVTDISDFNALISQLADETLGDFTMFGEVATGISENSYLTINVRRMVAKVSVTSIKTDFEGTPYDGMSLTNCKLYLVNAYGQRHIYRNLEPEEVIFLNEGGLVAEDVNSTEEKGLLMDEITEEIDDKGYSKVHNFFCYAYTTADELKCTKLILQATLDGTTFYYPIPINQDGYGHSGKGPAGISQNSVYSYGITVTRPGSNSPNEPLESGSVNISAKVEEWITAPFFDKTF